ncbi:MAG: hypothetical protein WCC87_14940 [Candidatus Korobacteraceae bacterium]
MGQLTARFSLLTTAAMMTIGFMTRYSGLDATMGLALARTGISGKPNSELIKKAKESPQNPDHHTANSTRAAPRGVKL